jgi:hypothetical protein
MFCVLQGLPPPPVAIARSRSSSPSGSSGSSYSSSGPSVIPAGRLQRSSRGRPPSRGRTAPFAVTAAVAPRASSSSPSSSEDDAALHGGAPRQGSPQFGRVPRPSSTGSSSSDGSGRERVSPNACPVPRPPRYVPGTVQLRNIRQNSYGSVDTPDPGLFGDECVQRPLPRP